MKQKQQSPVSRGTMVMLSEAKDLCYFSGAKGGSPEMFRFAQHDSMKSLRCGAVVRASLDVGI